MNEDSIRTAAPAGGETPAPGPDGTAAEQPDLIPLAEETDLAQDTEFGDPAPEHRPEAEDPGTDAPAPPAPPDVFSLKHLGEVKEVTRDELVSLAQKGMQYDFVREKLDRLAPLAQENGRRDLLVSRLEATAKEGGFRDAEELVHRTRVAFHIANGLDEAAAAAKVRREDETAARVMEQQAQARRAGDAAEEALQTEAAAFLRSFPGVTSETIPAEVWDAVRSGAPLTQAYLKHQNSLLESKLHAMEREAENRARSPGSAATAGTSAAAGDPFLAGWNSL